MASVMLQLGEYQFSMSTARYQQLRRVTRWRWVKHERAGRESSRQFVGPDERTLSLRGTVFPEYRGGLYQVRQMIAEADRGEPRVLVDTYGYIHGEWVIEEIEEEHTALFPDGTPRKIDFRIELAGYGRDVQSGG